MQEKAGLLLGWTGLQTQTGTVRVHMGECRVPVDASQRVKEKMLEKAIGQWMRWQRGRGWGLVSAVHVGKPRPTFDTRTGRLLIESSSYALTGTFEYSGSGHN